MMESHPITSLSLCEIRRLCTFHGECEKAAPRHKLS